MNGNIERSYHIVTFSVIAGVIIICATAVWCTVRLSKALVEAGQKSRSSGSSVSFPSELRVQLSQSSKELTLSRRTELMNAFKNKCVGQEYDNKTIKEIIVKEFKAKYWGNNLDARGDIVFEDGTIYEDFDAHFYSDGFGGYEGFVRTKDGVHIILGNVRLNKTAN